MCEFISWVERRNKVYFLTGEDLTSEAGQKIIKERGISPDDYCGHGTIRAFYRIDSGDGVDRECPDFSTPSNFPDEIVTAIQSGRMRGLGIAKQLLNQPALAEYDKINQAAWAEYYKVEKAAWAEYNKISQPAWAEYNKINQAAWAEYYKVEKAAWAEYYKVEKAAWAEYNKINQPAWAEYNKINQAAFWDLFMVTENRSQAWQ